MIIDGMIYYLSHPDDGTMICIVVCPKKFERKRLMNMTSKDNISGKISMNISMNMSQTIICQTRNMKKMISQYK